MIRFQFVCAALRKALCFFAIAALPAFGQQPFVLSSAPRSADIVNAKAALEAGTIVAMRNAEPDRFNSILNVGLPVQAPPSGTQIVRYCIAAARKTPSGRIRLYAGDLVMVGVNRSAQCTADFNSWMHSESSLEDTVNPDGWTQLISYNTRNKSLSGDSYSRTTDIYRANTTDPTQDYFMMIQENSAVAASGSLVQSNSSSLMSTYGTQQGTLVDYGPQGVTSANVFTLGSQVPVQSGSAAYTHQWNQTSGINSNGSVSPGNSDQVLSAQQTAVGSTTLSIPTLLYDQGAVFGVPKGTTALDASTNVNSYFQDPAGSLQFPQFFPLVVRGLAPVLSVSTSDLYVQPGAATASLQINASTYLNWTVTTPDWVQINDGASSGTGAQSLTFSISSATPIGSVGVINIDTSPSFASPSVASGPLQVRVHVVGNPVLNGVLFAGGTPWNSTTPLSSAEIWNPATRQVAPTAGPMVNARASHTATALPGGKVLIAGGFGSAGTALNTSELFDPVTGTFSPGPNMNSPHAVHTATLLADGTVLIAGGEDSSGQLSAVAEIYNPATNFFTQVGNLLNAREAHSAVLLSNGNVLIAGGKLANPGEVLFQPSELYDPSSETFTSNPYLSLYNNGGFRTAVLLANGQVLLAGGNLSIALDLYYNAWLYTPAANSFAQTTRPFSPMRQNAAGVLLPDQTALIIGGAALPSGRPVVPAGLTTLFDPTSGSFSDINSSIEQRDVPTAVLVPDPSDPYVIVAGGVHPNTGNTNGAAIELFDTGSQNWTTAGVMSTSRMNMTSTSFVTTPGLNSKPNRHKGLN